VTAPLARIRKEAVWRTCNERVALGKTQAEAAERIQEALAAYADDMREQGESLPVPHHMLVLRQPDVSLLPADDQAADAVGFPARYSVDRHRQLSLGRM
jgi:hypothetical protein